MEKVINLKSPAEQLLKSPEKAEPKKQKRRTFTEEKPQLKRTPEEEEEFMSKMLSNYIELPLNKLPEIELGTSIRYINKKGEFKLGGYIIKKDLDNGFLYLRSHSNTKIVFKIGIEGVTFYYMDRDLKSYKLHEQARLFDFFAENTKGVDITKLIDGLVDGTLKMTIRRA